MIFIANTLPMNGGSTFLLRICKELHSRGEKVAVLLLFSHKTEDLNLKSSIGQYADIHYLSSFSYAPLYFLFSSQLGIFSPIRFKELASFFKKYGSIAHVMGVFGLLFLARAVKAGCVLKSCTVGVYHQNEFMYPDYKTYFSRYAKEIFCSFSPGSIIFFNEFNVMKYTSFFGIDYSASRVVPIGIEMPKTIVNSIPVSELTRIVSIGNLVNFKTYNAHVINILPALLKIKPNLIYEIYGAGPNETVLKLLVLSLNLDHYVRFHGIVDYVDFKKILLNSFAFVGSGTAILEASALGVPSIVGIESSHEPVTYGFLSDVSGLAYNENFDQKKYFIYDKISWLLADVENWSKISKGCHDKSKEFSIDKTANIFIEVRSSLPESLVFNKISPSKVLFSICLHYLKMKLGLLKRSFFERRNEGSSF